jgi:hypothetical protein
LLREQNKEEEKEKGHAYNLQCMVMGSFFCYQKAGVWGFPLPQRR